MKCSISLGMDSEGLCSNSKSVNKNTFRSPMEMDQVLAREAYDRKPLIVPRISHVNFDMNDNNERVCSINQADYRHPCVNPADVAKTQKPLARENPITHGAEDSLESVHDRQLSLSHRHYQETGTKIKTETIKRTTDFETTLLNTLGR
jgi:hypothetical protein